MITFLPIAFYSVLGIIAAAISYMIAFRIAFLLAAPSANAIAFDDFILRCENTFEELRSDLRGLGWIRTLIRSSGTDDRLLRDFVEQFDEEVNRYRIMIRRLIATSVRVGFMGSLVGIIMLGSDINIAFVSTAITTTLVGTFIEANGELLAGLFAGRKTQVLSNQVRRTRQALQKRRERQYLAAKEKERERIDAKFSAEQKALSRVMKTEKTASNSDSQPTAMDQPLISLAPKTNNLGGKANGH